MDKLNPKSIKRKRVALSCTICRKRKIKCDKQKPCCGNCTISSIPRLCHYMTQSWELKISTDVNSNSNHNIVTGTDYTKYFSEEVLYLKRRLTNLEKLIDSSTELNKDIILFSNPQKQQQTIQHPSDVHLTFSGICLNLYDGQRYISPNHPLVILNRDTNMSKIWIKILEKYDLYTEKQFHSKIISNKTPKNVESISRLGSSFNPALTFEPTTSSSTIPITRNLINNSYNQHLHVDSPATIHAFNSNEDAQQLHTQDVSPKRIESENNHPQVNQEYTTYSNPLGNPGNDNPKIVVSEQNNCTLVDEARNKKDTRKANCCENTPIDIEQETLAVRLNEMLHRKGEVLEEQIIELLLILLPTKIETEIIIQGFFKHLYPTVPFLDSRNIIIQFAKIFPDLSGGFSSEQPVNGFQQIKLENYNDYCNLGIFILIIKFVDLSITLKGSYLERNESLDGNTSDIFENKIPHEMILILNKFLIKISENIDDQYIPLSLIQFTILCHIYMNCSTESDSRFEYIVSIKTIVQLALNFGLNIDPDNLELLNGSRIKNGLVPDNIERYKHTWRKTWYWIIQLDINQSLQTGTPRLLKNLKDFGNTKLPIFSNINYLKSIQELIIVKDFTLFYEIDLVCISIFDILEESSKYPLTILKLNLIIRTLKDFIFGKYSVKETLLTLDNLNISSKQESSLKNLFCKEINEQYDLPSMETILQFNSGISDFLGLEKKLEIPNGSLINPVLFLKHMSLRNLLFKLNWQAFLFFDGNSSYNNLEVSYSLEATRWSKDILNNCVYFFNETCKTSGLSDFLLMPALLTPISSSIQHILNLRLRNNYPLDTVYCDLISSITRLLEKFSIHNKRSKYILALMDGYHYEYRNNIDQDINPYYMGQDVNVLNNVPAVTNIHRVDQTFTFQQPQIVRQDMAPSNLIQTNQLPFIPANMNLHMQHFNNSQQIYVVPQQYPVNFHNTNGGILLHQQQYPQIFNGISNLPSMNPNNNVIRGPYRGIPPIHTIIPGHVPLMNQNLPAPPQQSYAYCEPTFEDLNRAPVSYIPIYPINIAPVRDEHTGVTIEYPMQAQQNASNKHLQR